MKKSFGLFLASMSLLSQANGSPKAKLCEIDPNLIWQPNHALAPEQFQINADAVHFNNNGIANFHGNVAIHHQQMFISAKQAALNKTEQAIEAQGPITFRNSASFITSDFFKADYQSSQLILKNAIYQFTQQAGHGEAGLLLIEKERFVLEDAIFTTCPGERPSWSIAADEINISDDGWGESYSTVLKLYDIPVLYLPYFTFPASDKRKTGFIMPSVESSNDHGLTIATPFYWNIAPNLDATLTPRYMANNGLELQGEFRYLTAQHQGQVAIQYLHSDDQAQQLGSRYLAFWQQKSHLSDRWRANIDVTNISDDNYLNDIGSEYASSISTQLNHLLQLNYLGDMWHTDIRFQGFEILGNHQESYRTLPQINFHQVMPMDLYGLDFTMDGEFSYFENSKKTVDSALRMHFEPKLSYRIDEYAWNTLAEFSVLQTNYYQQGDLTEDNLAKNVARTLPKVRLYGQLNLERQTDLITPKGLQTLEPKIQYLYIPEKDQSQIGIYDTVRLQDDVSGLFRDQRFSSVDRIATANQLTLGATTRLFNEQQQEVFQFSVGQIFFANDKAREERPYTSLLAAESGIDFQNNWSVNGGLQFDTENDRIISSYVSLDYQGDHDEILQLNHNLARNVSDIDIEQIGAFASYPIADNWQLIASYQRDLQNKRSLEMLTGIQYQSCCWALQFSTKRQIKTNLNQTNVTDKFEDAKFDSGYALQFIMGLDAQSVLNKSIFSYRRPYFITN